MNAVSKFARTDQEWKESIRMEAQALSNEILPDINQKAIRDLLDEAQDELDSLDTEIERAQATLDYLLKRRSQSKARIERLKVGVAPQKKFRARDFVKYLCILHGWHQGFSRWKKIAIAEPLLWNQLNFHWSNLSFTSLLELAHDVLSNRGGQGVVTLKVSPNCEEEWDTTLNLISTYPSRLRNLNFLSGVVQPKSFSTPLELFDNTESLDITIEKQSDGTTPPLHAFSVARSLRTVTIRALDNVFSTWPISLLLSWSQLTELAINGVPFPILPLILSQCVHLISCYINILWASTIQMYHGTNSIIMPDLQILFIGQDNDEDLCGFMEHLILPKLKTFRLYTRSGKLPYDEVLKLVSHSACTLETFFTNYSVSEGQLVSLMKAMPELTCFETLNNEYAISVSTLDTIVIDGLCLKLRILRGWKVASIEFFWEFLQRQGEASSPYGGIQEVKLRMEQEHLLRDKEFLAAILPEFETNGRRLIVKVRHPSWNI